MDFNLLDAKWLPVIRQDGAKTTIAPWEITDGFAQNPIIALDAPRADFNGALIQFLIGLAQTVAAPGRRSEWRRKLAEPPGPEELRNAMQSIRHAFELGGSGPRFMQDYEQLPVTSSSVDALLIENPGEQTKKDNKDHFVKRGLASAMCPACCATALFALQTNAPSGGSGIRTSLRGGGPLTTLIAGDARHATLWHLVWLNVLEQDSFLRIGGATEKTGWSHIFPWLALTRTSEKNGGVETTPADMHPAVMFWAMPRRIRLDLDNLTSGQCEICGNTSDQLIQRYQQKNYGMNFTGPWLHPLSPYSQDKDGQPLPAHAQPGGICYRHWLGFVQNAPEGNRMPARVVHEFFQRGRPDWQFRLWSFGYDMDNMKARCWYESVMPLIVVDEAYRTGFSNLTECMIKAATEIMGNTRNSVKKAWFRRPADAKGDMRFVDAAFWNDSEPIFYQHIHSARQLLESKADTLPAKTAWHRELCRLSLALFDTYVLIAPVEDADPRRIVQARKELGIFNHTKKIKEILGFPTEATTSPKKRKKKEGA